MAMPSQATADPGDHLWVVSLGDSYTAGNGAGNYADGNYILIDGRFGLPLCDVDGNFLTMPTEHDDHDA